MTKLRLTESQAIELKLKSLKMAMTLCGGANYTQIIGVAEKFYEFIITHDGNE